MNIFITLDYELFFGSNSGTQEKSIIYPTNKLLEVLNKYGVKASFFVDSGYLIKLDTYRKKYDSLEEDYHKLILQIKSLSENGHDIQLHIHPHWEDSYYDGSKWVLDTTRYRLHEFSDEDIDDIVYRYKKVLTNIVGDKVFTYRAGGWCIQPFQKLTKALKNNDVWLDSTLFENGFNESSTHYFDFRKMVEKSNYRFEDNPLVEKNNGFFTEIPISSNKVSPWFYWKFAYYKKFGGTEHQMFGDGQGLSSGSKWDKMKMLLTNSHMAISMDGYKSSLLQKSFKTFQKKYLANTDNFVMIGHPKALTPFSLEQLELFIQENKGENFTTYLREFKQ